ncbi:MAG TPA: hypothetical protein VFZ00_08575 [Solirubrobacter sp.]|nr:hypothetical protein [Solirubrobacter sp.]
MTTTARSDGSRAEAEWQLAAATERHREVVASMQELGRSEAGQLVAIKSVGRAVHLVSFTLRRAADAGVPFERLVELTGWEPDLVREGLERVPEPRVIARLAPPGVDPNAVAQAAAASEAITRLRELTQRVLADVDLDLTVEAPSVPGPADLEDRHDRLETAWSAWRQALGRRET